MVLVTMMAQCRSGAHDKCPKIDPAPPGEFGGVICDCACHYSKPIEPPADAYKREVETEFWLSIRNGTDPDDFKLYLEQFPDGTYAALAREKLAKLKPTR